MGNRVLQYNKLLSAQAHLGPADLEAIKIINPIKLKEIQSDRVNSKKFPFKLYHTYGAKIERKRK